MIVELDTVTVQKGYRDEAANRIVLMAVDAQGVHIFTFYVCTDSRPFYFV